MARKVKSATDDVFSPFAVIATELRVLLKAGWEAQEVANRLGRMLDVMVGEIAEAEKRAKLRRKPPYIKVIKAHMNVESEVGNG